jgi:hypothetical protein
LRKLYGLDEQTVYLSPAPLYHAAPLRFCMGVNRVGGTVIVMEKFDPETALRLIETHRVTTSQWVPTHFVRMLKLSEGTRSKYDLAPMRHPRRRALSNRNEATDDRMVGASPEGILRRDRIQRHVLHQVRGMVEETGVGGQGHLWRSQDLRRSGRGASDRRRRNHLFRERLGLRLSQRSRERRSNRATNTAGRRSATSGDSTKTAISI